MVQVHLPVKSYECRNKRDTNGLLRALPASGVKWVPGMAVSPSEEKEREEERERSPVLMRARVTLTASTGKGENGSRVETLALANCTTGTEVG